MSKLSDACGTIAIDILTKVYAEESGVPREKDAQLVVVIPNLKNLKVVERILQNLLEQPDTRPSVTISLREYDGDLIQEIPGDFDPTYIGPAISQDWFVVREHGHINEGDESWEKIVYVLSPEGKDVVREHLFETRYSASSTVKPKTSHGKVTLDLGDIDFSNLGE